MICATPESMTTTPGKSFAVRPSSCWTRSMVFWQATNVRSLYAIGVRGDTGQQQAQTAAVRDHFHARLLVCLLVKLHQVFHLIQHGLEMFRVAVAHVEQHLGRLLGVGHHLGDGSVLWRTRLVQEPAAHATDNDER